MILNVFGVSPFYGNAFEQKFFSVPRSLNRDFLRSFQLRDTQLQRLEDEDLDKRHMCNPLWLNVSLKARHCTTYLACKRRYESS